MDNFVPILSLLVGLLLRLAVPIAATILVIVILRKLDKHWQSEAKLPPAAIEKPECWKIKGCTPEQRKNCPAVKSSLPCWQVHRLPNGYLNEACLSCSVFIEAPIPTFKIETRSL